MNYALYLQNGAELAQPEIEKRLGKEEVDALVKAVIVNQDEEAARMLVENAVKDPENEWIKDWMAGAKQAAENGDENAIKFWLIIQPLLELVQQTESFKCGGKVRAKIKKAACGKKMQAGDKILPRKKDCPCKQWKKVGGKLVETDCENIPKGQTGLQLAKIGIKSLITPFRDVRNFYNNAKDTEKELVQNTETAIKQKSAPVIKAALSPETHKQAIGKAVSFLANNPKVFRFVAPTPGMFLVTGLADKYAKAHKPQVEEETPTEITNPSDSFLQRMGFTKNEAGNWVMVKNGIEYDINGNPVQQLEAPAEQSSTITSATQAWRNNFGTGKFGKFGGLTYDEALARQNEMASAGFTNFGASDGMWGNKSKAEWERYQKWKEDQDVARLKAENSTLTKLPAEIKGLTTEGVTIKGGNEPDRKAMLATSTVNIRTPFGNSYFPATYIEDGTGRKYSYTPLSKNGGKLSYYKYIN